MSALSNHMNPSEKQMTSAAERKGKTMRLIDLDSLPKESMTRMTLRGVAEVDAIPISWILKWSAEHMNEYGTYTVERLIEDWRKESGVQT